MPTIVEELEALLAQIQAQKTGDRSEEQRKIAILATKVEDSLAWAKHTYDK